MQDPLLPIDVPFLGEREAGTPPHTPELRSKNEIYVLCVRGIVLLLYY